MKGERIGIARPVGAFRAGLGECPVWDGSTGRLHWICANNAQVLTTEVSSGETLVLQLPEAPGAIVPMTTGGLACAAGQGLYALSEHGFGECLAVLPGDAIGRLNDGKCDALGRFWCGTATQKGEPLCTLYRFAGRRVDGVLPVVQMSNGLGWSPDNKTMYFVDTGTRRLDAFDFELESGRVSNRRTLLQLPHKMLPDGLAVDRNGGIWLAIWGGGCVLNIHHDGQVLGFVAVPAEKVTSCAFGGPKYRNLFVTTAADGDQGGEVFVAEAVAEGTASFAYAGCVTKKMGFD